MKAKTNRYSTTWLGLCCFILPFTSFAQTHVTMSLINCATNSNSTFEFDLYIVNDGNTILKLAGCSFGINYNQGILNGGAPGMSAFTFQAGTQDAGLTGLHPYNLLHTLSNHHMRISMSPQLESSSPLLPAGVSLRVGRFTFTNTNAWFTGLNPALALQLTSASGFTNTIAAVYINGATNTVSLNTSLQRTGVVNCTLSLPVDEVLHHAGISVFPNPFKSAVTFQFNEEVKESVLTLYNLFGDEIKTIANISGNKLMLNRENLNPGIYFYRFRQDNGRILTDKLVITD